jgi:hypothetical protein
MAGYSETPPAKILGIKPVMRMVLIDPPGTLADDLGPLPEGCRARIRGSVDDVHGIFVSKAAHRKPLPGLACN